MLIIFNYQLLYKLCLVSMYLKLLKHLGSSGPPMAVRDAMRQQKLAPANRPKPPMEEVRSTGLLSKRPALLGGSMGYLNVPIFHITQPLGIWSFLSLLFLVMSNSPKMGHLPIPGSSHESLVDYNN